MSESSKDAPSILLSPPRSLMYLEDAEEIWTIITKRYPKAAPLLCEMESVLDHAEDLLQQLQSPSDLGIVFSTDESLNVEESKEMVSNKSDMGENFVAVNDDFKTPSILETENFNIDYLASAETDSFLQEEQDHRQENLENPDQQKSDGFKQEAIIDNMKKANSITENYNKDARPAFESKVSGKPTITKLNNSLEREKIHSEEIKIIEKPVSKLGNRNQTSNETGISILHFKSVVEAMKLKESNQIFKDSKSLKTDMKTQGKLDEVADIIRMKLKESRSIDGWDKVVGNSSKSCETLPSINTGKLATDEHLQEILPSEPINKTNVSSKSTTKPLTAEANLKIHLKQGSHKKKEQAVKTGSQGSGDEKVPIASAHGSPIMILEQYASLCNKTIEYLTNDDRTGKIEITCSFANYKVSSVGKLPEMVKNEAAARMLHMLATSQMEENMLADLQEFDRQQVLEIINLDKGDKFIPSVKKLAMVKLYHMCLEQNLPEPQYEVKPDTQYRFLSTCKILHYIGQGSGRTDKTAKEKAAEDFYKKHFQKFKNQSKDH